jgi:hypothetical protein
LLLKNSLFLRVGVSAVRSVFAFRASGGILSGPEALAVTSSQQLASFNNLNKVITFENPEVGYKNGAKNFKTSLGYGNLDI